MINFETVVNEFKELGFDYDRFDADTGYRDIFTSGSGVKIYFYLNDDEHNYLVTGADFIDIKLHNAITDYMLVMGWFND